MSSIVIDPKAPPAPPPKENYGVFEGSILLTANPVTAQDRKLLNAEQLEALERNGGYIIAVTVRGQLNAHGLGRALGAALQCYVNEVARGLGKSPEEIGPECVRQVLGPMLHYANVGQSLWAGKVQ